MSDDHPTLHIIMTINGHIDHLDHDQGHYHHMDTIIYENHPIIMTIAARMREMFKPSMAELGLCMYQVGGTNIFSQLSTGGIMF